MDLDKENIITQDELDEPAPIDKVEDRVQAEMKKIEGEAKKKVGDGMQNQKLAGEGEKLKKKGERDLKDAKDSA